MLPHAWLAEEWAVPTEKSIRGAGDGMGRVGHPLAGRAGSADVPSVSREIRALVCHMARANPLWGAPCIDGELAKLGIEISQRTVGRLLPRRARLRSQSLRAFLENHVRELASMDFFFVPTATFRVLFVLIILAHERRRIVHFAVTDSTTAAWTGQQIVEAFPNDSSPELATVDAVAIAQ